MKTSLPALQSAYETLGELSNRIHSQHYDWNADPDQMTLKTGRALELLAGAIHEEKHSTVITLPLGVTNEEMLKRGSIIVSPGTAS